MGLFDNLFKPKSPPSEEKSVETGTKPAEPATHSDTAARGAAERPDPSAFLHPKSFVPRGLSPLAAPPVKPGAAPAIRKLAAPAPPPPGSEHIVLTLGDVLSRIPTPYLQPGNHDPKRELRFSINDLSSDIARGRAAVPLSRIAQIAPDIFVKQITREEDMEVRLPLQKLVEQIGLLRSRPDRQRQGVGVPSLAMPGHFALAVGDAAAPGRETLRDLGALVEPVFELKSVESAELAVSVEEEPVVELKPLAETVIVQFPLAAGAPEVATPPDLAEEDTTDPEPEVAEPVPSPTKEVAATSRVEEKPAQESESFEALVARLEKEAAARFSEKSSTHADKPPAVARETTLPAAESVVPTVESTAPPTEQAVDAKPDQSLPEKPAPVTEPPPVRSEAPPAAADPILPKAEDALLEPIKPAEKATASSAEPVLPTVESVAPSKVSAPAPVEPVASDAASAPPPIAAATSSPASSLPVAESKAPVVAPEVVPMAVSAPITASPASSLPVAESKAPIVAPEMVPIATSVPLTEPAQAREPLPPAVPVAEKISKSEIAPDVPAAPGTTEVLPAARASVPERPVIPSPAVKETTEPAESGGEKIQLSLAAILRQCPREIIVGEMPHVPDSVRITLPFAPIDRQLVQGHVEISAVRFVAAIPFTYQKHFSARMGVKVPIPLEEVFQNLPSAVPDKPVVSGPPAQILAPAFPEEKSLAAIESLPPLPDAIELAPAAVSTPRVAEPTGIESVMAMLNAEIPPPFQRATELPRGVEMPPLESVAEVLKGAEKPAAEKAGQVTKPVEPAVIESQKPFAAEPPPLPKMGETPQRVATPLMGGGVEEPRALTPAPDKKEEPAPKPVESISVEQSKPTTETPPGVVLPPISRAVEMPKTVEPSADRKGEPVAKAVEPVGVERSKPAEEGPQGVVLPPAGSATEVPKAATPSLDKKEEPAPKAVEAVSIEHSKPAEEAPQGVDMPSVASALEAPKALVPPKKEKPAMKPVEAVAVESAKPSVVEPPPLQSEAEAPKAVEPVPEERTTETAKSGERLPVEGAAAQALPAEGVAEAPKAIKPARIKKASERPAGVEPAPMRSDPAKSEIAHPLPVEGAGLVPQTAESQPVESAAMTAPLAEAPVGAEESSSSPASSETPPAATAPGAPPMEATTPETAPAALHLPAFHQFTPPPPHVVPEAVEPAPVEAVGSVEAEQASATAPHLAPAAAAVEPAQSVGGVPEAATPSALVPEGVEPQPAPAPAASTPAPETRDVSVVPQVSIMSPAPQPFVPPTPGSAAGVSAPDAAIPPAPLVPPPAPPTETGVAQSASETVEAPAPKAEAEEPAPTAADPSLSVFAEATQTIRPPQMVRPFIILPPPILGFTPAPSSETDGPSQAVENKGSESNVTLGSGQPVTLSGDAPVNSQVLSFEPSSVFSETPVPAVGPTEPLARKEETVNSPRVTDAEILQALVPPIEAIPADPVSAAEIQDVPRQVLEPVVETASAPVFEVIPPVRETAAAAPAAEKPAGQTPPGIKFVAQGQFTEPPAAVAPPVMEPARESIPEPEPMSAAVSEPAPAPPVVEAVEPPAEPAVVAPEPESAAAIEAEKVSEPEKISEPEKPAEPEKPVESEAAPLLHIPQIAAALEAAAETEILPPPAFPLRRFDQDALQALFMTEETLDLAKISRLAAQLPGVHACVIATRDQACTGGTLPEGFDLAALLGLAPRVNEAAGRMPIGNLKHFTLYGERYSISFFARDGLSLCAVHRPRSFVPGVREKLVAIADELSK